MSDTFIGDAGVGITIDDLMPAGSGFTKLYGIAGNDDLGTDVPGHVYLDGGAGDDLTYTLWAPAVSSGDFYGGSGNDRIEGGASATGDLIYGGGGDDWINQNPTGPGGSDYIEGGQGRDGLYGAGGNDIFDFNSAQESAKGSLRDLILDFKKGDRIDLSDIAGGLDFIGKKGFHREAGEIRLKKGIVQADFDGNGKGGSRSGSTASPS